MQDTISQLISLQLIDTRIAEINLIILDMPTQTQKINDRLDKVINGHESIKEALDSNKQNYLLLEVKLDEDKELFANSQKKLTLVQNNKEYQSVLREQDMLKKSIDDNDKKLKEMISANFSFESEYATSLELIENLKKEMIELQSNKKEEDKELYSELEKLTKDREDSASKVTKIQLSKYNKIRNYRNNLAITKAKDEVCSGCFMHIPPQLYVDIKLDNAIYLCPHCQRILYYIPEEETN